MRHAALLNMKLQHRAPLSNTGMTSVTFQAPNVFCKWASLEHILSVKGRPMTPPHPPYDLSNCHRTSTAVNMEVVLPPLFSVLQEHTTVRL